MVVTCADRRGRGKVVQLGNWEWAIVITCISTEGWSIPSFLVVKGSYHLLNWYTEDGLLYDWVIKLTSNGQTTNETGLDWLKYFDKHTASCARGLYCILVLDRHKSHESTEFQEYCKVYNIITLCLSPYLSYLT